MISKESRLEARSLLEPKIYVGWDSREDIAYQVCRESLVATSSVPLNIVPLKQENLRRDEVYWRDIDTLGSTEFTFTRFLVPYQMGYKGWALFIDCDFVFLNDVKELFDQADEKYAVMCVKHDYTPQDGSVKMDGQAQFQYPRKNWSSMMLINCGHPSNKALTLDLINNPDTTGAYLHRFSWLKDSEIGSLSHEWNWLVGWYKEPKDGKPKALHYTEGGPWFEEYKDCEYASQWYQVERQYLNNSITKISKKLTEEFERPKQISDLSVPDYMKNRLYNTFIHNIDPKQQFYNKRDEKVKAVRVAAIAPDKEDFNLDLKGVPFDPYLQDFVVGSDGTISKWETEKDSNNPLIIRGLGGTSQKALKHCLDTGREFYYIDTGYMGNGKVKRYHRVTKNGVQNTGPIIERPHDRLQRMRWKPRPFQQHTEPGAKIRQANILICPPSAKVMKFYGENVDTWLDNTINEIKKYTDRPIVVRLKQERQIRATVDTIWQALEYAYCLVTYNSIAATEALLYGVPAIALAPNNAAKMLCNTSISEIENLNRPTNDEILAFAAHLSYCQFTAEEMRSGFAWKIIDEAS